MFTYTVFYKPKVSVEKKGFLGGISYALENKTCELSAYKNANNKSLTCESKLHKP